MKGLGLDNMEGQADAKKNSVIDGGGGNAFAQKIERKFSSPQEEIAFLHEQIAERENSLRSMEKRARGESRERHGTGERHERHGNGERHESHDRNEQHRDRAISDTIDNYKTTTPESVYKKGAVIPEKIRDEIILRLHPEQHDDKMGELISMAYEKGILNVLAIVAKMNNPHIDDDFHRFLVQYLKEGYALTGLKEATPLARSLRRTLFEVSITAMRDERDDLTLEEVASMMEQFYAGMLSIGEDDIMTVEITNAVASREFIFYVSVSDNRKELFEKQLLSVFPTARIQEHSDDFNVFVEDGVTVGAHAIQGAVPVKPIKTYDDFKSDPLKVTLNVFSKLDQHKEAAAIQLVFKPAGEFYNKNYRKALEKLQKGDRSDLIYLKNTRRDRIVSGISKFIGASGAGKKKKGDEAPEPPKEIDSTLIEQVKEKLRNQIVSTNIRVLASATTGARAAAILEDIKSAFNQFDDPASNQFSFEDVPTGRAIRGFFRHFTYREFDATYDIPLNLAEIATIVHFPTRTTELSPQLRTNKATTAPAPLNISDSGILLGTNSNRGLETKIYFAPEDRLRHFYTIGQTGTGKTNLMKNMIIQDILAGEGVCMIDPHGSDIRDVLANIPPERVDDVIYFDPADTTRPMALNMLEYDPNFPEQKTFVVNELFGIFMKLYGANPESMGPMFEQYFRNATQLVIEDPSSGATLLDVSRVLADASYRRLKLSRCRNPIVKQFWEEIAQKAGGEASLQNIVPYITSKFDVFLANDIMRPVVAQEKSSFNFRHIMDERKILLVNLSKGRLGDINSSLIGLILVGKILMAALSRVDSMDKQLPTFYLYIDEFQNVTTDSIATILSEARKYKLSLNIAHQFIAQLDEKIKDAVFGNVGSMAVFRVGSDDAKFLEAQFEPTFSAADLMNIDNFNAYVKLLVAGTPVSPFNIATDRVPDGDRSRVESLQKLSSQKYGRDRADVENAIAEKYLKKADNADVDVLKNKLP